MLTGLWYGSYRLKSAGTVRRALWRRKDPCRWAAHRVASIALQRGPQPLPFELARRQVIAQARDFDREFVTMAKHALRWALHSHQVAAGIDTTVANNARAHGLSAVVGSAGRTNA